LDEDSSFPVHHSPIVVTTQASRQSIRGNNVVTL